MKTRLCGSIECTRLSVKAAYGHATKVLLVGCVLWLAAHQPLAGQHGSLIGFAHESSANSFVVVVSDDSIQTRTIRKGIIHTEYTLTGPYTLDVLTVDLTSTACRIGTFRPDSLTRTSVQARQNSVGAKNVVTAINADFFSFSTHWPQGNQVKEGMMIHGTLSNRRSHFVTDVTGRPYLTTLTFHGSVMSTMGKVVTIDGVNLHRDSGTIVLYNMYRGQRIRRDSTGWEMPLRILSDKWVTNDTMRFVVGGVQAGGTSSIRDGNAVLAFGAESAGNMKNFADGDTVRLYIGFREIPGRVAEVIGGSGRILWNGEIADNNFRRAESLGQAFLRTRHPRTFLAIDKDTTRLYLCTVDGRQKTSIGMNFEEMAKFLLSIGAWNAINLDGGGSTTMVIDGQIVNSPSDKSGERAVANSLQVIEEREYNPSQKLHPGKE